MKRFRVIKGDRVKVISGRDKGKIGKVLRVIKATDRVLVSGVFLGKKHTKPTKTSEGGIVYKELSVHVSNVSHIDPKTNEITKIGYKFLDDGAKVRFAKKSGEMIIKGGK